MDWEDIVEDRVYCDACRHCTSRGCFRKDASVFFNRAPQEGEVAALPPHRCRGFAPLPGAADQRGARQRWPGLWDEPAQVPREGRRKRPPELHDTAELLPA